MVRSMVQGWRPSRCEVSVPLRSCAIQGTDTAGRACALASLSGRAKHVPGALRTRRTWIATTGVPRPPVPFVIEEKPS